MIVNGLLKTTLLDYPGHVAATVFLGGCNFRCPFCHNRNMVLSPENTEHITEEEFFRFLGKRKGVLTGICITGGEPSLRPDLPDFLQKIKDEGLLVKLDTNGSNPSVLKTLHEAGLIDYVAMDVKSSLARYDACADCRVDTAAIKESIDYILHNIPDYEFRTTVVRELHSREDFEEIGKLLCGARAYYLQYYRDSDGIILPNTYHCCSEDEMLTFVNILKPYVPNAQIRGEMPV